MKNRNKIINLYLLLFSFIAYSQVKFGDNPANIGTSSLLELESSNKALLITRVATTASILSPVNGMLIYDLSANCIKGYQNGVWTECLGLTTSELVLIQIGNEGDSPNTVPSVVTTTQLASVPGVTGVVPANQAAYQAYIDANPSLFSAPATVAEVNAMIAAVNAAQTSGGTALVSAYSCSTASAGTMFAGTEVSGVTQTITATVTTVGTYSITTTANGVTFAASGTFAGTGAQNIVLTATGTPTAAGSNSFTLDTTPNCSFSRTTNAAYTVPATITLAQNRIYMVASVYDQDYLPYTAPTGAATAATAVAVNGANEAVTINVQGSITTGGVAIKIPVTATGSSTLPAFSQTINIPAGMTEDGIARDVTLSWAAQAYTAATTTINATIAAVGGKLNTKKLDIQTGIGTDALGILMGQFTYPYNNAGATTTYSVRVIAGIPDRNIADANHRMLYFPVTGADGNIWLNNNLGADYSNTAKAAFNPAQQATSATDHLAYGSLFQWGRKPDGHELITWTSASSGTIVNGSTTVLSNDPANSLFILNSSTNNWRTTPNDTLWATESSVNTPCPIGFRVPTDVEITALVTAYSITNSATAFSSQIKFTVPAFRYGVNGSLLNIGSNGYYWSSSVISTIPIYRTFSLAATQVNTSSQTDGLSVRCIKDNTPAATIGAINCAGATNNGTLTQGTAASGVNSVIPYTGGNGGVQYGQTVASTGVTGLTATLDASLVASGAGNLTYTITGTPASGGTASFAISVGGQSCTLTRTVAAYIVPATITLAQNKTYMVASVYDQDYLPYTAPTGAATTATAVAVNGANEAVTVNVQGSITTGGAAIKIPVTATGSSTLPAFSQTINIPAGMTEDGIARDVTLSWAAQAYTAATKTINATLAAVGGTLNAKKLDIQTGIGTDALGILMGQFTYPYNNAGATTTYSVRFIAGIPDRMFGLADNNGNSTTHMMLYVPTVAEDGNIWLNNNLGAHYSNVNHASFNPAQQATSGTDHLAYGSLFQWGRKPDGHELITYTNSTIGTAVNGSTSTNSNAPAHALFILDQDNDWRVTLDDTLWATAVSANNPCPVGFKVPTLSEQNTLVTAASITNSATAASSTLKFTAAARRIFNDGTLGNVGSYGGYWSSSVSGISAIHSFFTSGGTGTTNNVRAYGFSVRCIKD